MTQIFAIIFVVSCLAFALYLAHSDKEIELDKKKIRSILYALAVFSLVGYFLTK